MTSTPESTKALGAYLRLRHRREKLSRMPPDTKVVKYERFTVAEQEQLQTAERQLNRLNGADAIELFIAQKSSALGFL